MSLVAVGSVALDTVYTPGGELKEGLGGSAVFFSVAANLFSPVCMVGVVGSDFPEKHIESLRCKGIDLAGLKVCKGKTFRWHGRYDQDLGDPQSLLTELNVFAEFSPELPDDLRKKNFLFLGNIHPQLQLKVLSQMENPMLIAADTMNYWIESQRETLLEVLSKIDMVVINELEVRMLTGLRSVLAGAERVQKMGPATVVVKRGAYGAFCLTGSDLFVLPAYPTQNVLDPTGAGDSFAGGMIGYIASQGKIAPEIIRKSIVYGTIVGSYCVEGFSIKKLEVLTRDHIESRYDHFKSLTRF